MKAHFITDVKYYYEQVHTGVLCMITTHCHYYRATWLQWSTYLFTITILNTYATHIVRYYFAVNIVDIQVVYLLLKFYI